MFLKELFSGDFPILYIRTPLRLGFEYNILASDRELALVINGSIENPEPSLSFEGRELLPDFVDEDDLGKSFTFKHVKTGTTIILYVYSTGTGVVELTVW